MWRKELIVRYGTLWDHIQEERAKGRVPFRENVVHDPDTTVEKSVGPTDEVIKITCKAVPSPLGFFWYLYKNDGATFNHEPVSDDDNVSTHVGETDWCMFSDEEEWNVVSNDHFLSRT